MNQPLATLNFGPSAARWRTGSEIKTGLKPAFWHDNLIDYMLVHPEATLSDLATYTGRSVNWLSLVRNSDAFKARYEQRRREYNEQLADGVQGRLMRVAAKTLDVLELKLDAAKAAQGGGVTILEAGELTDKVLERLGYGVKAPVSPVQVHVNQQTAVVPAASATAFQEAQAAIRAQQARQLAPPSVPPTHAPASVADAEEVPVVTLVDDEMGVL